MDSGGGLGDIVGVVSCTVEVEFWESAEGRSEAIDP